MGLGGKLRIVSLGSVGYQHYTEESGGGEQRKSNAIPLAGEVTSKIARFPQNKASGSSSRHEPARVGDR